jgi:hypothetical protein
LDGTAAGQFKEFSDTLAFIHSNSDGRIRVDSLLFPDAGLTSVIPASPPWI